ncbi:GntR family transcriptional regulator [Pedobacter psychrotolerans]|uniref:Transcriptional regulator n=1 Tax=Pedobacter psychrotolerans TaxID=1843235 RepID=A0A4R2HK92_9SPHI|nr:GntR family transcriptional regulator [Pedobacter psychrotolerans]TCO28858.1 GntR family transcriptional regulator [Pedobacter psychrotolerans]GGE52340.1 transcriptional regulator [Pedobacter psychrotolerans]
MKNYLKFIKLNEESVTPKYLQIFNSVLAGIETKELHLQDTLPSINDLSMALEVARNTVERAYGHLKKNGVVDSVPGKGYFISSVSFDRQKRVLLLFNKLSNHKKIIYDALVAKLGANGAIDFYIYNNDFRTFKKLIEDKAGLYDKVVIIPHFFDEDEHSYKIIDTIPKDKLVLVDKMINEVSGNFRAVYEDFEKDIYHALEELNERLRKYQILKIIFPANSYYSKSILAGFINFCVQYAYDYEILSNLKNETLMPGTVYINLMEDDLIDLIDKSLLTQLVIGKDIGIISYNETPIKRLILNGITTISTDFVMMGETTADMIMEDDVSRNAIPFKVTLRNSV